MNWINVKDRLPEKKEPVLFFKRKQWVHLGYLNREVWIACGKYQFGIEGTFWMPLPDPPEEE